MAEEERVVESFAEPHTTETRTVVIERRGGGTGAVLFGLAVLIAVVVGAFYFYNKSRNDDLKTSAVTSAAKSVGDSAQKVGDSAEKTADSLTNQ